MSRTYRGIVVGFTVRTPEHLPGEMDDDDVKLELMELLQVAVADWYDGRGAELLVLEPEVF